MSGEAERSGGSAGRQDGSVAGLSEGRGADVWLRRGCAVVVAAVAACASYEHQRTFALDGGADPAGTSLWPLSVDGLLVLATIGLLKPQVAGHRRT